MADWQELVLQIILAALAIGLLAFGGEEFRSDYEPGRKWIVGANWFKRGFREPEKPEKSGAGHSHH